MNEREQMIMALLADPEGLLMKRQFFRGSSTFEVSDRNDRRDVYPLERQRVQLPRNKKKVISQERFAMELDPECHNVMFDDNLPSICVKLSDGQYMEIEHRRMPLPFQERIREKQTLTMCGNPRQFSLQGTNPNERDKDNFAVFKEYWEARNQDGMTTKAVYHQLGYGDVGLLYYHNSKGEIKSRVISYEDGYTIISHNDKYGERLMECVYYSDAENVEHIDCYTDKMLYRIETGDEGWKIASVTEHGFSEIPLVTKRGEVGWNKVQSLIEAYEILYNVFMVIEKRHGWGILYIKGKFSEHARKLAGSIILNDTSIDGNGSAEFKSPPNPEGFLDCLNGLFEQIEIGSSCTFLLPKDVKANGDVSALAIMLTQSLDIEGATSRISDWQNFMDKSARLFKEGLAKELVRKGVNAFAVTEFADLRMSCKLKIWRPFNETEYNTMLCTLKGAGVLSTKTAIERSTVSAPDEEQRVAAEEQQALEKQQLVEQAAAGAEVESEK